MEGFWAEELPQRVATNHIDRPGDRCQASLQCADHTVVEGEGSGRADD